jgi:hypothetical protein
MRRDRIYYYIGTTIRGSSVVERVDNIIIMSSVEEYGTVVVSLVVVKI